MAQPIETHDEPATATTRSTRSTHRAARLRSPALDIAARSVLESHALDTTVASLIAERALDHHREGLYQYATLRVGREPAAGVLERLEQALLTGPRDALEAAPGPRARLYHQLRALVAVTTQIPLPVSSDLFHVPSDARYASKLIALRRMFEPAAAELLELRYARQLSVPEIAYVLGSTEAELESQIPQLLSRVERALGRRPPSHDHTLEGALLEAFALDPRRGRAPRKRPRPRSLEPGTVIAGRYEIEAPLGSGAFAEVYRARDRDVIDHVVALKILRAPSGDEQSVKVALRELQLIASVFHPSIVALKDHGWHERRLWLVMPLYRGETLAQRLRRGPLSRSEARAIFEPLAEALATMHRAGVLHQDIKPDNVFLATLDPRHESSPSEGPARILPVLLDLGVAAKDAELVLAGTPAYFAPEIAARFAGAPDPAPVGPKADVFSLALTLRHALDPTPGEFATAGSVDAFVAFRAAHAPQPPAGADLRDLKPSFERWLSFSPDPRPTADELRSELAVLTRKREQRERRISLLRWALPTFVAVIALFGWMAYVLSREAAIQRLQAANAGARAAQARERAANMYQSLTAQQARGRALEADVARLQSDYQSSKMTREQLANRLAQTESDLELQRAALAQRVQKQADDARSFREQRSELLDEAASSAERQRELNTRIERLEGQIDNERNRAGNLNANVEALNEQLQTAQADLQATREREREAQSEAALMRQALLPPASVARSRPARAKTPQ